MTVYWYQTLAKASFRGVAFKTFGNVAEFGRRNSLHEYPFRDKPWVEDLGRATRVFRISGFLLASPSNPSGADLIPSRDSFIEACETGGTGDLVLPTYKSFKASLIKMEVEEAWDRGRMFHLRMTFIESGDLTFPTATYNTTQTGQLSALQAFVQTAIALKARIQGTYQQGAAVIQQVELTTQTLQRQVQDVINDATNVYNFASTLPGATLGTFGRYFGGNTRSGLVLTPTYPSTVTVDELIAQGMQNREAAIVAMNTFDTACSGNDPDAISAAMQALVTAILTSAIDPGDAIRLLISLAGFQPPQYGTSSVIGNAMNLAADGVGDCIRRCVVTALAQAALLYQPQSSNDAATTRNQVCALIDAEIEVAGNQGEDSIFTSFRAMYAAVAIDLGARGAALPGVVTYVFNAPLPAPVLALRLYRDASRSDLLVAQVNPIHPMFMPVTFKALSS